MNKMYFYKAYGLFFSSELCIPELETAEDGIPDVVIRLGSVPCELPDVIDKRNAFQAAPDHFLFRWGNVAGYYVKDGREIVIEPYIDRDASDIRLFLLGSVFAALLQQRGFLVLHGSSVVIRGRGIILTGKSGIGKSTLAAAFGKRNYRVLADDVCALKLGEDKKPYILPGFPSLKLWKDMAEQFGLATDGLEPVKKEIEKYRIGIKTHYCGEVSLLSDVYILEAGDRERIEIQRVNDMKKLVALIQNTYRYRFLKGQQRSAVHFSQCAAVAEKTRIFRVLRPKTGFMLDELVSAIEENVVSVLA